MTSERSYENTRAFLKLGLSPLIIVVVSGIAWIFGAILWVICLVINLATISLGGFVFVIVDWAFIGVNWLLVWIFRFVIGYFTSAHWFNWQINVIIFGGALVIGLIIDLLTGGKSIFSSSTRESQDLKTLEIPKAELPVDIEEGMKEVQKKILKMNYDQYNSVYDEITPITDAYDEHEVQYNIEKNKEELLADEQVKLGLRPQGSIVIDNSTESKKIAEKMRELVRELNIIADRIMADDDG